MYRNYKLILFLGAALIFLYMSVGKYEEFSLKKSISACVLAKSKLKKDMSPQEARKVCEVEIKQNKWDFFYIFIFSIIFLNYSLSIEIIK